MSFKIFVLYCSVLLSSGVLASGGDCRYGINKNSLYGCTLSFHNSQDNSSFTAIGGTHIEGKTDDDVLGVWVNEDVYSADVSQYLCNKFKNLEQIFFQKLVLSELPENSFSSCKNLNSLILKGDSNSNPHITKLPQNLLSGNPKLTHFEASLRELRSIPENFFTNNLKLKSIDLGQNKLRTLPADIFKSLDDLNKLTLSNNDLRIINPAWFEGLKNLEILFLVDNHITDIPKNAFNSLINLKVLLLSFNDLKTIHSDSFGVHRKLEEINFIHNKIDAIDEKFIDNIGVKRFKFNRNYCESVNFYDENGVKRALKKVLKPCFENYQPRVDVGERGELGDCKI